MIVGCYSLDLYCDGPEASACSPLRSNQPAQFTGQTERDCLRTARRVGWRFTRDGKAYCRNHAGAPEKEGAK